MLRTIPPAGTSVSEPADARNRHDIGLLGNEGSVEDDPPMDTTSG